jgi:uncharacterized repeat protein (TIGR03803 family)
MRIGQNGGWFWAACALAAMRIGQAQTATETVIFNFSEFPQGANPYGTLFRGTNGTLYGTTYEGGAVNLGAVFELGAAGYKVLHSFKGGSDGANPYAGVVRDSAGNLYGTTYLGGPANAGVVYKVTPSGQETVLYAFTGETDGGNPYGGMIVDSSGNLYGTTLKGGMTGCSGGCGVVYKVNPSGQETVLHSFTGGADGATPYAGVISDSAGNLYGTTYAGGANQGGVVYELSTSGQETVLHSFGGGPPGYSPTGGLARDSAGNLYGTNSAGVYEVEANGHYKTLAVFYCLNIGEGESWSGVALDAAGNLYGTTITQQGACGPPHGAVFKLTTAGTLTELYRFPGASAADLGEPPITGSNPGVVLDPAGKIYGTSPFGGTSGMIYKIGPAGETMLHDFSGAAGGTSPEPVAINTTEGGFYGATYYGGAANVGTVYELDRTGRETVLHSFTGGGDGAYPTSPVVRDSAGNLYGTTKHGGAADEGVVYKADASGDFTVLHRFTGGADGGLPNGVVLDPEGNLYGATNEGGAGSETGLQEGVLFKLDPAGNETVLYSFTGLSDGGAPNARVTRDASGNLYGTTSYGGRGAGVVYKLSASGEYTVLHTFTAGADGGYPYAGVVLDSSGNLYGTTPGYGVAGDGGQGQGVVFKLSPSGTYTVLYTFVGGADGGGPMSGVVRDKAGNLYGTTIFGGDMTAATCVGGCGVAFEVSPSGQETVLHTFTNGADGTGGGTLILNAAGDLYGNAGGGGSGGAPGGLLYKIALQPAAAAAPAERYFSEVVPVG